MEVNIYFSIFFMKLLRHIYFELGLGLKPKRSEKKDGLPSQSGRGRTGKY